MKAQINALAIMAGLLATAVARAPAAAAPPSSEPRSDTATSIDIKTLTALFLAANPAARNDPAFARDWTAVTKCAAWTRLAGDEFRAAPFLKAGAAELAATRDAAPLAFELRLDRNLDRYDAGKREFGLRTLGADDVLPIRIDGYSGAERPPAFKLGCDPTSGKYPVAFEVSFENPDAANGLPMQADVAAAFAEARTNQYGNRDTHVTVALKLRLTLGAPRPVGPPYFVKGLVVPVSARVEDVIVDDGTSQHKVIYRLDQAKRQAADEAAAEIRRQVRAATAVRPLDAATLTSQFEAERIAAKVGTEPAAIGLDAFWSKEDAPGDRTYRLRLKPGDRFGLPGTAVRLRFDNAAEVAALSPTPELVAILARNTNWGLSVTYVPVGATDDRQKGGPTIVGHVLSVETVDGTATHRRVLSVRTASAAVPWTETEDNRPAASFDLLGLKAGMGVDEVTSSAEAALGQKLAFDQSRGLLQSPPDQCDLDIPRRGPPPLGKRCLTATFGRASTTAHWALIRLRLRQTAAASQVEAVQKALVSKYGGPDLVRQFNPPGSLSLLEGEDRPPATAIGWGARLSDRRPEPDGVPMPLHVLEAVTQTNGGMLTTTLTLTDGETVAAAADAEAAAKRAADAIPTKF